ncbi:MAG: aldo/keto reductase [Bacteroidota bacterium]
MLQPTTIHPEGPTFSRLVAGVMTWGKWGAKLDAAGMADLLEQLVDMGITTIDHADIYGDFTTEEDFGKALATVPHLKQKIQLVTKCGIQFPAPGFDHPHKAYQYDAAYIIQQAERSLRVLGVNSLDLLLLHRPSPLMDPDEVAEAFTQLKTAGKVQAFGVSNFTPSQYSMIQSRFPLYTNQVEASLLHLQPFTDGTFDQAQQLKSHPMAWSPLGGGTLFAKEVPSQHQKLKATLDQLAEEKGTSTDVIMIAWLPANIPPSE